MSTNRISGFYAPDDKLKSLREKNALLEKERDRRQADTLLECAMSTFRNQEAITESITLISKALEQIQERLTALESSQ